MNGNNSTQGNATFAWPWTLPVPVYIRITLYSILLVWSLLANMLVIAVVYYNQNLRTNMNYLIVNMAVSDLLIALVTMPYKIVLLETKGKWLVDGPFGEALCKLVPFLSYISPFVSSISLAIIAVQRYMAVAYLHRGQILGRRTRWIAMSFPWIEAMALHSPFFYAFRLTNENGYTRCNSSWSLALFTIFRSVALVVGFVVPLIVIVILYTMIIYNLRRSLDNVRGMMEKEMVRSRQRRNKRTFSMLITIVVLFTICWIPVLTLVLIQFSLHSSFWLQSHIWSIIFAFDYMWYLLAAINPCIYFVFLKDFRQGLKNLCCRKNNSPNALVPRRPPATVRDSNQEPTGTPRTPIYITSV